VQVPAPPAALAATPVADETQAQELLGLSEVLKARTEDVLQLTVQRTSGADHAVDALVQESFERICNSSTIAVARWIAGEGLDVAVEAGRETWEIFGELAAHRAASLNEVTWRCFTWRNVMVEVIRDIAKQQSTSAEGLAQAAAESRVQSAADVRVL